MLRAVAASVLLACLAAAPAGADFSRPYFGTPHVSAVAGDAVVVYDGFTADYELVTARSRVRLFAGTPGIAWQPAASAVRLAGVQRDRYEELRRRPRGEVAGPYEFTRYREVTEAFRVFAAPLSEPSLTRIARCRNRQVGLRSLAAVVAGGTVAWRDCDARAIATDTAGLRASLPTGGTVVALTAAGDAIYWITARDGAPALLERADARTGDRTVLAELPVLGRAPLVTLAATPGGRAWVTFRADPDARISSRCDRFDTRAPGLVRLRGATCGDTPTDTGAVGLRTNRLGNLARVEAFDDAGGARRLAQGRDEEIDPTYAVADGRVGIAQRTCTGWTVALHTLEAAPPARPLIRCPVRLLTRQVRADRRGDFRVRLRCPRGCAGLLLRTDRTIGLNDPRPAPGRAFTLRVGLVRPLPARLRRQGRLAVPLVAFSRDDRRYRLGRVTVLAPR